MRKTKIICTLGPSTDDPAVTRALVENGMNVARLNFSHGNYEEQQVRIDMIKRLRDEMNVPVGLLMDTKGPEIRLLTFEGGKAELKTGSDFVITTEQCQGTSARAAVNYPTKLHM